MFDETQTIDVRAVRRSVGVRIRTIPESEPDDGWEDPIRHDDPDAYETFPWPSHEEGLRELEDEEPTRYQAISSGSVLTTLVVLTTALVLFATSAFSYFTR